MDEKISIVIPAYNASKYINNMLLSLYKQSYKNFEIILVDDGSVDNTVEIVKENALFADGKLKVINQENGGVSKARNTGIDYATGKFIVFIDADDTLERDFLKILINPFNQVNEVDLSIVGYFSEYENKKLKYKTNGYKIEYSNMDAIYNAFILFKYEGYPWNKMYRASIIQNNNLRFNEAVTVCEDLLFFVEYSMQARRVLYNPRPMYHYVLHSDSTINGRAIGNSFPKESLSELDAYMLMMKTVPDDFKEIQNIMKTRLIWTNSYLSRLIYASPNRADKCLTKKYKEMRVYQRKNMVFFLIHSKYDVPHKLLFISNIVFPRLIRRLDVRRRGDYKIG